MGKQQPSVYVTFSQSLQYKEPAISYEQRAGSFLFFTIYEKSCLCDQVARRAEWFPCKPLLDSGAQLIVSITAKQAKANFVIVDLMVVGIKNMVGFLLLQGCLKMRSLEYSRTSGVSQKEVFNFGSANDFILLCANPCKPYSDFFMPLCALISI